MKARIPLLLVVLLLLPTPTWADPPTVKKVEIIKVFVPPRELETIPPILPQACTVKGLEQLSDPITRRIHEAFCQFQAEEVLRKG